MARARIRRSSVALAAVVAVTVAGCGVKAGTGGADGALGGKTTVEAGAFEGSKGASFLNQVASTTAKVETLRVSMEIKVDVGGQSVGTKASGDFDNPRHRGHLTMDMGDILGADTGSGGNASIEEVVDGSTIYMRAPMLSGLSGSKKPWIKVDASGLVGGATDLGTTDPSAFLAYLESAGGKVTTVGKEDVRGTSTTHVRTSVDLADMAAKVGKGRSQKLLDQLGVDAKDFGSVPVDAWIGDDGYVRKVTLSYDTSKLGTGLGSGTSSVTIEMYDFNEPVDITIPPASQVTTVDPSDLGGPFGHGN